MQIIAYTGPLHIDFGQLYDYTILCMHRPPIETRNKSNDFFESMQYRQDVRHKTRENTSLPVHVVQKITIILAQKIGKSAVRNLILCSGAIWRPEKNLNIRAQLHIILSSRSSLPNCILIGATCRPCGAKNPKIGP